VTLDDYAARLSDPLLRKAFPTLVYDWPQQSMLMLLTFMGRGSVGDYGWPQGGSHALAEAVEARFRALGGEIRYGQKVAEILVEDGRAAGVRLQDGREERADIVISNANGHATIYGMLGGRFTSRAVRDYYGAPEDRIEMGVHVSLGVARDLSGEPHALVLPLPEPTVIDEEPRARLYVEPFGFDPSLAPPGKATLKVVLATSWRRWAALAQDPQAYAQAKDRIAQTVIGLLEPRWPGLRSQIEAVDVATPITTQRFTGNGQGYKLSVAAMTTALITGRRLSPTLPGLADFYMVGQWAGPPGGVPLVAAMGRDTVRRICRRDGRSFRAFEGVAAPFEPGHRSAA
jgi:phytoene dehydrogenase-like protein